MNYYMPTKLYIEKNALINHKDEFKLGKKCLIVTGKSSAKKSGALNDVIDILNEKEISYDIFDEIVANPTMASCLKAGKLAEKEGADFVIGIGGGSALDASKVIAMVARNKDISKQEVYDLKWNNKALPLILIGTTAGTGSEVTKVAVITDEETNRKKSGHHDDYYAKVSFGDPSYTMSLSKETTLSTGIDALAHLVESYFSNKANEISRAYSIEGVKVLLKPLTFLSNNNEELSYEQREQLYIGSILGGLAINVTGTTFAHTLGYYLTENYNKPHGIACAIFMQDLIDFVSKDNKDYAKEFFKNINISKDEYMDLIKRLLPINDIKMSKEEIDSIMPRYKNNNSVNNTKGHIDIDDIRNILEKKFL